MQDVYKTYKLCSLPIFHIMILRTFLAIVEQSLAESPIKIDTVH